MNQLNSFNVESKIIIVRNTKIIIDRDVAELYGVETKEINQAYKNNPDKFLIDYVIILSKEEKIELVKNFDHLQKLKFLVNSQRLLLKKGFIC